MRPGSTTSTQVVPVRDDIFDSRSEPRCRRRAPSPRGEAIEEPTPSAPGGEGGALVRGRVDRAPSRTRSVENQRSEPHRARRRASPIVPYSATRRASAGAAVAERRRASRRASASRSARRAFGIAQLLEHEPAIEPMSKPAVRSTCFATRAVRSRASALLPPFMIVGFCVLLDAHERAPPTLSTVPKAIGLEVDFVVRVAVRLAGHAGRAVSAASPC